MTGADDEPAASRRFVAASQRMHTKWVFVVVVGSSLAMFVVLYALHRAGWNPAAVHVVMFACVLAPYLGFVAWARKPKKIIIDVAGGRLSVNEGADGVFPLQGAMLGTWYTPVMGTTGGMALHVTDGRHRFVLGGLDHRTESRVQLDASPVGSVDASIPAADFDELLEVFGHGSGLGARAAVAGPIRCLLFENSTFQRTVAGLLRRQPRPKACIELDGDVIRLIDAKNSSLIAWAARSQVTAVPGRHSFGGGFRIIWPVLDVRVPGLRRMLIANPDSRYMWKGQVPRLANADFIVSTADWRALVKRFGLTGR